MTSSLESAELRYNRAHAAPFQSHGAPPKITPRVIFHSTIQWIVNLLFYWHGSLTQGLGVGRKVCHPDSDSGVDSFQLTDFDPFGDATFCIRAVKLLYVVSNNQAWKNPGCFSKRGNNFKIVLMFDGHKLFWWAVAILEWKKWGNLWCQRKSRGGNINIYLAWLFFIVLKIKLLWLTLSNPT